MSAPRSMDLAAARGGPRGPLALALSALLTLGACSCGDNAANSSMPRDCTRDSDCGSGETCFADGCGSALEFAVRVTPLDDNGLPPQDYNPVSVGLSRMDLSLQPAGALEGALRIKRDATSEPVLYPADGDQTFTIQARGRSSAIPNLAFDKPVQLTVTSGAQYTLAVPPGVWDVSAITSDPNLPPVFTQKLVGANAVVDPGLTLVGDPLLQIAGRLLKDAAVPWPSTPPKFWFQVFDPDNTLPLSQRSLPVLGGDPFQVFALRTGSAVLLRASPDPTDPDPVPAKDFPSYDDGHFDPFVIGDYGDPVDVTGQVTDAAGAPVANAQVNIQGVVNGGGTLTAHSQTDGSGAFAVRLLASQRAHDLFPAAEFRFTVSPPADSPASLATLTRTVSAETRQLPTIVCPAKVRLAGRVVDGSGASLANVLVAYEGNPRARQPGPSRGDVKTDANGEFAASVDPGEYRVTAKPAPDPRPLPWASRHAEASADGHVLLPVSAPRVVYGTVTSRTPAGAVIGISNTLVQIYRVPPITDADPSPVPTLVFEALTDGAGNFKAVVPSANPSE